MEFVHFTLLGKSYARVRPIVPIVVLEWYNSNMETRVKESPLAIARYETLKKLGKEVFAPEFAQDPVVSEQHVARAKEFLSSAAKETKPQVWASYWEHILIAPELGKRLAEKARDRGVEVNPHEVEFSLLLHDVGRYITPGAYLRNDLIGDRLLKEMGVPVAVVKNLPSVGEMITRGEELDLTDGQLVFEEPLTSEQEEMMDGYFASMNPTERIICLSDNLGKRDPNGLFSYETFISYLKGQEGRYLDRESPWASIHWATKDKRRQKSAVYDAYIIERTLKWLFENGVDYEEIRKGLLDFGPKFVVVARHGELNNPTNIVYNRDSAMSEVIHLSEEGRNQMHVLGKLIKRRGIRPIALETSPETRAQESSKELNLELSTQIKVNPDLDEVYAPGPYEEKMTIDQETQTDGGVYNKTRWGQYNHESRESVIERVKKAFWDTVNNLKIGQAGVILSHGDTVAWLVNTINGETPPNPSDLRSLFYPGKGEALLAVVGPDNEVFTMYLLTDDDAGREKKTH